MSDDPIVPGAAARDAAKIYLRIGHGDEDALIDRLVTSAAQVCEQFTGQALLERAFNELLPASARWTRLRRTPVREIVRVEGLDAGQGAPFALPVTAYAIDIDANGDGWVRVTDAGSAPRARVAYRAGLAAEWVGVPEALRQGIVRLTAHLYTHRDGGEDRGPPAAVTALWRPWRRLGLR